MDLNSKHIHWFCADFVWFAGAGESVVALPGLPLIPLIYSSQMVNAAVVPLHIATLLLLAGNADIMGEARSSSHLLHSCTMSSSTSSPRTSRARAVLAVLSVLTVTNVTSGMAQAQDAPKPAYEFAGDFSLAASQGNQQVTTIALGQRYSYKFAHWKFSQSAAALRGTANGVQNAELYQLSLRSDHDITKKLTAYLSASGLRNTPAGLNSQLLEGVGLGYQFIDTEIDKLQVSLGVGALQRTFVGDAESENDFVGNASGNYRHAFSKVAYLEQTATFTPNFTTSDAWLLTAKSAVVAPLSARFGIKVGYLVNFNNAPPLLPPVNGVAQTVRFKKFDGLLTTGIQFTS